MESLSKIKFQTVDEYISFFPANIRGILEEMRTIVKEAAPEAREVISYNMPAIKLNGVLVYYAANKSHIGFYPTPSPIHVFKKELADFKTSKGAIQFPIEKPIPKDLVKKIVMYRVKKDEENAESKMSKRK